MAEKLIATIRDAIGALAALGLIVYLTGGAIVGLRLAAANLPTTAVVGQLPRNVLISVGLAEGLLPIIILAAAYMGLRSLLYQKGTQTWPRDRLDEMWGAKAEDQDWRAMGLHILWTVAATIVVLAPAVAVAVLREDSTLHRNTGFFWQVIGVIAVLTFLLMLLYLNMRARLVNRVRRRYRDDMTAVGPTLLHSLLVVVALVPGSIAFWSARPLERATACLTPLPAAAAQSMTVNGYLVGDTSDHVYIGEMGGHHPALVSLPSAQVRDLVTGQNADAADCVKRDLS